jgi:pantetheine-phosphate adenylyltransferase
MVRAVFPGTFDPIHFGHIDIALRARRLFDELIVAVYDRPLKSLLFSPEDRLAMAEEAFAGEDRIRVAVFSGLIVNYCRQAEAQVIVRGLRVFSDFEHEFRMALANHRLAPEIDVVALITSEEHSFLSGSTVREIALLNGDVSSLVPPHVAQALQRRLRELGDDGPGIIPMTSFRD